MLFPGERLSFLSYETDLHDTAISRASYFPSFLLSTIQNDFVIVVQSLGRVHLFATPWTAEARLPCSLLSPRVCPNSRPRSQQCPPTISSSASPPPLAFSLFQHQGFPDALALRIRCPKYWSLSFGISPPVNIQG